MGSSRERFTKTVRGESWQPLQPLTLTLSGAIFSSGSQQYSHQGGTVVAASILGQTVDPAATNFHYSLKATVSGVTVSGTAEFFLSEINYNGHSQANSMSVQGQASITGMIPAEAFPLFPTQCTFGETCTSAIAGVYTGVANVQVTEGGTTRDLPALSMSFESAFLNPFGGPLFLESDDGSIFIESTYSSAQVNWSGVQLEGTATGYFAGSTVNGLFGMTVNSFEDLKKGFEVDSGNIAFSEMSISSLDATGSFSGFSTIPQGSPCPSTYGLPPGTCSLTGFNSIGFISQLTSSNGNIQGTYKTIWTVPAVAFTSTVVATVRSAHG